MPKRSLPETTLDVLRLSENQWAQMKGVARHFLGEQTFHASLPKYPPTKLKPSALRQIVEVDSPSTLAALLHVEEAAHTDPLVDYHKGGGPPGDDGWAVVQPLELNRIWPRVRSNLRPFFGLQQAKND